MKHTIKCPKCKKELEVSRFRSSYVCPFCNHPMIITREDIFKGYKPYRNPYKFNFVERD